MKNEIEQLIKKYREEIKELVIEQEKFEYEPAPSGEVNESLIPINLIQAEIDTYALVIMDLLELLESYNA